MKWVWTRLNIFESLRYYTFFSENMKILQLSEKSDFLCLVFLFYIKIDKVEWWKEIWIVLWIICLNNWIKIDEKVKYHLKINREKILAGRIWSAQKNPHSNVRIICVLIRTQMCRSYARVPYFQVKKLLIYRKINLLCLYFEVIIQHRLGRIFSHS